MGTSSGCTETSVPDEHSATGLYPGRTIFDTVEVLVCLVDRLRDTA
jgi:hypothetical protein